MYGQVYRSQQSASPTKNGKRTFSDEKFVKEIRETFLGRADKRKCRQPPQVEDDLVTKKTEEDGAPVPVGEISQDQLKALLISSRVIAPNFPGLKIFSGPSAKNVLRRAKGYNLQ